MRDGRLDSSVRFVGYGLALRKVKRVVMRSRRNPDEFALHSLRYGGAETLAADRDKGGGGPTRTKHTCEETQDDKNVRRRPGVASDAKETAEGRNSIRWKTITSARQQLSK